MDELLKQIKKLKEDVEELKGQIYQSKIAPKQVKQRHIDGLIVFKGSASDRPTGSTEVGIYFSTDTNTLNIWNGTNWVQEVLT